MTRLDLPRASLLVALAALAASCTSLGNGFALDDFPLIVQNSRVHTLEWPWHYFLQTYWPADRAALYRPLTVFGFALEWAMGRGSPVVFHTANVLLYVAAALMVLRLAWVLLPPRAALVAAALFAVHPVHVEAVANCIGQPEVLVGLMVTGTVAWYIQRRRRGPLSPRDGVVLALLYLAALLVKEHGAMLPALLALAEVLLVTDPRPIRDRAARLVPAVLGLVIVFVGVWSLRTLVTGGLVGRDIHPVFRAGDLRERLIVALSVFPEWLRLFLFPVHLSADYNPQQIPLSGGLGVRALAGAAAALLGLCGAWRWRSTSPVASFGLLWAAVALFPVSNLLVPTGILLAERTLFLPSVGVMLALGAACAPWIEGGTRLGARGRRLVVGGLALVMLAGAGRSAVRQLVWKDNLTLFRQTALDAPRSYKARAAWGVMLLEGGRAVEGEREYLTALELYDGDPNLFADLGDWYLRQNRCADALSMYARVLRAVPDHWAATSRTILCLTRVGRLGEARLAAEQAVRRGSPGAAEKLAFVDSLLAREARGDGRARAGRPVAP